MVRNLVRSRGYRTGDRAVTFCTLRADLFSRRLNFCGGAVFQSAAEVFLRAREGEAVQRLPQDAWRRQMRDLGNLLTDGESYL
jgi:hypothetical protein